MKLSVVRDLHETRPFIPFTLSLSDGRRLEVIHNEFLAISPTERYLMLIHPDGKWTMIDVAHLASADADPEYATRKPKAGGKKR